MKQFQPLRAFALLGLALSVMISCATGAPSGAEAFVAAPAHSVEGQRRAGSLFTNVVAPKARAHLEYRAPIREPKPAEPHESAPTEPEPLPPHGDDQGTGTDVERLPDAPDVARAPEQDDGNSGSLDEVPGPAPDTGRNQQEGDTDLPPSSGDDISAIDRSYPDSSPEPPAPVSPFPDEGMGADVTNQTDIVVEPATGPACNNNGDGNC
jgi:hypothetical protein